MTRPGLRVARFVAVWLGVATFFAAQNMLVRVSRHGAIDWQWDVLHEFIYWLLWAAVTPLFLRSVSSGAADPHGKPRTIPSHLIRMVGVVPLQELGTYGINFAILALAGRAPAASLAAWMGGMKPALVFMAFAGCAYYWMILGVHAAFVYPRLYQTERLAAANLATRAAQLEGQLAQARLDALQLQLHPHFLFNTLNAIAALAAADPAKAQRMLGRLGELLRQTLVSDGTSEVSLTRELELLAPYLEIQRIRFGDRLEVREEIDGLARGARLPALVLQPLVENAVQHGVNQRSVGAIIVVRARREGDRLVVEVEDNGTGLDGGAAPRPEGIGLGNTRARLVQLYGEAQQLTLRAAPTGGAVVRFEIPFRTVG